MFVYCMIIAPARPSEIVKQYLKSEKVTVLSHPMFSPDPPCNICIFPKLKIKVFIFVSDIPQTSPWLSLQSGPKSIFISYLSYQLYCCALPDKRCLSHGMLPLSGHDDVALFE